MGANFSRRALLFIEGARERMSTENTNAADREPGANHEEASGIGAAQVGAAAPNFLPLRTQAEGAAPNDLERPIPEPETGLEATGDAGGGIRTPGSDTGQVNAGKTGLPELKPLGFSSQLAAPFVPVKLGFPELWPETAGRPFLFKLEYLISADADREQSAFLRLSEEERAGESYRYDCRMIAFLSVEAPEGFSDFPAMPEDFDAENAEHRKRLAAAVFAYLFRPGDRSARAFAFVARHVMSRYWARINPRDYL
jgi:hypothetical protein